MDTYCYKIDTNGYIVTKWIQMDTYCYKMDKNGYINVSILKYKLCWNSPPSPTEVVRKICGLSVFRGSGQNCIIGQKPEFGNFEKNCFKIIRQIGNYR